MKNKKGFVKIEVAIFVVVLLMLPTISVHTHGSKIEQQVVIVLDENVSEELQLKENEDIDPEVDNDHEIVLTFSFDSPIITEVNHDGDIYHQVLIDGMPVIDDSGVPLLPLKPVNVLLPQKGVVESIDVTCEGNTSLGTGFNVELGREPVMVGNQQQDQNVSINFDPMIPYPTELFSKVGTYDFRGYSILTLCLYPVHYILETGELYYYEEMTVTISFTKTGSVSSLFRGFAEDKIMMQQKVDDACMSSTYIFHPSFSDAPVGCSTIVDSSDSYEYVIVTSDALKNANGEYTFQGFIEYKNERGTRTTIVTVEEILSDPCYWNTTSHIFNDTPAKIRNFIRDAYMNWGVEYVLIGCDYDVIPARHLLYKDTGHILTCFTPSDLYYACLDGSFNSDEDNKWGERTDGEDGEDVDLRAEVYVGRACVDDGEEVSNFVKKTLAYENTIDPYLGNVLLAGEKLNDNPQWGGDYLDELVDGCSNHGYLTVGIPSDQYEIDRLYDRDWPSHDWPESEIIDRINNEVHIINHMGHANPDYNMKIKERDVNWLLTNNNYFFAYSQGCAAGAFDDMWGWDSIAEYFTVKASHGAFAGIWNSRSGWYVYGSTNGASQRFHREFWDAIFGESENNSRMREIGVANQDSKEDNIYCVGGDGSVKRWLYYGITLFGDPQVAIKPAVIPEHDIVVKKLYIDGYYHGYVPSNETLTVNAYILNKGSINETNVLVNLTVDGAVTDDTRVDIERNGAALVSFECILPSGVHEISIEAEPVIGETITYNNVLNEMVIAGPDVALIDVDLHPSFYIDCSNEINVTVVNYGVTTVNDVYVSLLIDDEVADETTVASLSSGETVVIPFSWTPQYTKWYNISAFVEPVADEGYTNNNGYDDIMVHSADHTVYVNDDGDADFETIQDAVNWVGDGDVVYVFDGLYTENVEIENAVSLIGEDKTTTIINGNNSNYVVSISADEVTVTGFTIQNTGGTGIKIWSNHANIDDNIITNITQSGSRLDTGIVLHSSDNSITRNIISNISAVGIYLDIDSVDNVISENIILNVSSTMSLSGGIQIGRNTAGSSSVSSFNNVIRNTLINTKCGILIYSSNNTILMNDILNGTEDDISVFSSFNNIAKNNISGGSNGIKISSSNGNNNTFSDNIISNNTVGIAQSRGSNNVFFENAILNNVEGIKITYSGSSSADNNTFHRNNFINNSQNAYDECENQWYMNYWDDYNGTDADGDGIGDTPYDIPGGSNQDIAPMMNLIPISGNRPYKPSKPLGPDVGYANTPYTFSTYTTDIDGDNIYYRFEWGDNTNDIWLGPYGSGETCIASHIWHGSGIRYIRVKAKDATGRESEWSDSLLITMINRPPSTPDVPTGVISGESRLEYEYTSIITDPDDDQLYYLFDWGDGTNSGWLGPVASGEMISASHIWRKSGYYTVKIKAKDSYGLKSEWSASPVISMANQPPEKPSTPFRFDEDYLFEAGVSYELFTRAEDKNGEQLYYKWEWGFNDYSDWLGPYDSGETVMASHIWDTTGIRLIRVKARDIHGDESEWSDPRVVIVPTSTPLVKNEISDVDSQPL